jgi:protein-S-isoprenylcysteine O-methyltransferase Ste14
MKLELKIPPIIQILLTGLIMWFITPILPIEFPNKWFQYALIFLFVMSGSVFSLAGVLSFKKHQTTVNPLIPEKSTSLVKTGIYSITRNPMYLGFFLKLIAWALFLSSYSALLCSLLYLLYINHFQIIPEEKALLKLFGEEYQDYIKNVRRWI